MLAIVLTEKKIYTFSVINFGQFGTFVKITENSRTFSYFFVLSLSLLILIRQKHLKGRSKKLIFLLNMDQNLFLNINWPSVSVILVLCLTLPPIVTSKLELAEKKAANPFTYCKCEKSNK